MERTKLSTLQMADMVMTLVGSIEPVGQDNIDGDRFNNLCYLQSVIDVLLDEIVYLLPHRDSYEYSVRNIGLQSERWLREKRNLIGELLGEENKDGQD